MSPVKILLVCCYVLPCSNLRAFQELDSKPEANSGTIRIVLAGDSTVTEGSGWGLGFRASFNENLECSNLAQNGRSSRSYRTEGWWGKVLEAKPHIVVIQFGHNDQPGKGWERESSAETDFQQHLEKYVNETRQINAKPVLVTSLERRRWKSGRIEPTLNEYAKATRDVAERLNVPLIDLQQLSIAYYEDLGATACRAIEPMSSQGADHTHLNEEGSIAIGGMVASRLVQLLPELTANFMAMETEPPPHDMLVPSGRAFRLNQSDETISVTLGDQLVLAYNKRSPSLPEGLNPLYARSGFIHPVFSPAGQVVTATFPKDHPHQHGIFNAWVQTIYAGREIDFWNLAGGTGRVLHQRLVSVWEEDSQVGFEVDLIHQTASAPIVDVLRERWKVTVYPTDGTYHCFDIDSSQKALTNETLLVKQYHYGGMAIRGPVDWLEGNERPAITNDAGDPIDATSGMLTSQGSNRLKGNHELCRWVAQWSNRGNKEVCVAVLSHPSNFRSPQPARLHPSKPYFCFAPCVTGEFKIDANHPLNNRYRYLVTDNAVNPEWIDQQWNAFASQ